MAERRSFPGTVGYLWCPKCKARLIVAGKSQKIGDGPTIEPVACPYCQAVPRAVLPPFVGIPFRVVIPGERTRDA